MSKQMEELQTRKKEFAKQVEEQNKKFAEEERQIREEERERRRKEEQQFRENLVIEIMNEYGFNKAVSECVVRKGWEDGHYAGYNEVRTCSHISAEFAKEVLKSVEIY